MSTQALNSEHVRDGMKDILLNYAGLWEGLRGKAPGVTSQADMRRDPK